MKKLIASRNSSAPRDPFITKIGDKYYRCYTEHSDSVSIACADSLDGLSTAEGSVVFLPQDPAYSKQVWAPELHLLDGKCYIYVACDDGENHNHRMYVLGNDSADPTKPYSMLGKITDPTDKWAIDGNVVSIRGTNYFIWSGWEGEENVCQNLYIARMKSPTELDSERYLLSTPEYDWEKLGSTGEPESPLINEGAFGFCVDGEYYVTYSGAGSWCKDYCIALLKLVGDNPLDRNCWKKWDAPILSANDQVQGAGHCSVLCEDDKLLVFFHAWDKDETKIVWNTVAVWQAEMHISGDAVTIE